MKVSVVRVLVVLLFALSACSGEDQQPPQTPPPKVVQPIRPLAADIEKPATPTAEQRMPQAEEKAPSEKPAAAEAKPAPAPTPAAEEKKAASEAPANVQAKKQDKEEQGIYSAKTGDTLSSISARPEVLKDPLKWPILLRLNRDKMGEWAGGDVLPDRELPQGAKIKVLTAPEARVSLKKESSTFWVVNVLSTTSGAEIAPPAVTLVKQGYPVYIVRANVKGKDYMRLRVGFFKNKEEADEMGKKVKTLLNFQDSWSTRADKEEYEEMMGLFKSIEKH
ncbi:MAG: SPOR domain-containing protein [Deltaproteobacteria bacterium]